MRYSRIPAAAAALLGDAVQLRWLDLRDAGRWRGATAGGEVRRVRWGKGTVNIAVWGHWSVCGFLWVVAPLLFRVPMRPSFQYALVLSHRG